MRTTMAWVMVLCGLVAGSIEPAGATCVCGDVDGCGSAIACKGLTPGTPCSPPKNASCKIKKGTSSDAKCCCGCSRGNGISCVYSPVATELAALNAVPAICCIFPAGAGVRPAIRGGGNACRKLDKVTQKRVAAAQKDLTQAEAACQSGKAADAKVRGAESDLTKLRRYVHKQAPGCEATYNELIDRYLTDVKDIRDTGATTRVTTSTSTSTTSSTNLGGLSCDGQFTFAPPPFQNDEVDFLFSCMGAPGGLTAFRLVVVNRAITNFIQPMGFSCMPQMTMTPNDTFFCQFGAGTFDPGSPRSGRLHLVPGPTAGMGAQLFLFQGSMPLGPFNVTGP